MDLRFRKYAAIVLISSCAAGLACSESNRASPTAPSFGGAAALTAEPQSIVADLLPGAFCGGTQAFRISVALLFGSAAHDQFIRRVQFEFTDTGGRRTVATTLAAPQPPGPGASRPGPSVTLTGPIPVTMPGATSVPGVTQTQLPAASIVDSLVISAGVMRRLPFLLEFGCGATAAGTLVIVVDTSDDRGVSNMSRVSVQVRS